MVATLRLIVYLSRIESSALFGRVRFQRRAVARRMVGAKMKLVVEISTGELIDKITILEIKLEKIRDEAKRRNIAQEYQTLIAALPPAVERNGRVAELRRDLKVVNAELWQIEDDIRAHERAKTFGFEFVTLARSVYLKNDRRATLKREINSLTGSRLIEEKSYEAY
jgi:hypothetical protein